MSVQAANIFGVHVRALFPLDADPRSNFLCPDRASHASVPSYDDAKFAENQRSTSDRVVQRSAGVASGTGTVPGGEQFQRENMFEFSNNGLHVSCEFVPQPQFEDGAGPSPLLQWTTFG
ncbi:hypothetical protein Ancab_036568 [Ancistrocladus abbreviatus]